MKIVYTQNPLRSYFELSEQEKADFKQKLYAWHTDEWEENHEEATKWTDHQYPYFIEALTSGEEHWGDCVKLCTSCTKCHAEDILGVSTTKGLKGLHYISGAFGKDTTIDEAIEKLNQEAEYNEEWHKPHIERWTKERTAALESLIWYKEKYFAS
jgi:hypothetical protein